MHSLLASVPACLALCISHAYKGSPHSLVLPFTRLMSTHVRASALTTHQRLSSFPFCYFDCSVGYSLGYSLELQYASL